MWRWRRGVRNDASTSQQLGGTGRMQGPALRHLDRWLPASRLCRSELPWSQLLSSLCEPVTPAEGHGHAPSRGGPGSPGSRPEKPPPGSVTSVSRQQKRERADAALSLTRATVPPRLRPPCGGGGVDGDGRMTSPKPPRLGRNVPADASGPVQSVGGPEPGVRVPREPPKHANSWAPGSSSGSWRPRTPQVRRVFLHPPRQLRPWPPACSLVPSPPASLGPANAPTGGGAPHPRPSP